MGKIQNAGTKAGSEAVARALNPVLPNDANETLLANYYRVEHTTVGHNNIPRRYG